ncbi:VOC family protein [Candidatus Parcubacteria bacterium]|nr:VOC family protein [Candidatus Parcubacteria bacterium]
MSEYKSQYKNIFVNLPVKDIGKTRDFWTKLGFNFNPQFSDERNLCLVIHDNIFAMLLSEDFFKGFTKVEIADPRKANEAIVALSAESREDADGLFNKAVAAGGVETRPAEDMGWMYGRAFQDLDGHQWEVVWMDMAKAPAHPGEATNN